MEKVLWMEVDLKHAELPVAVAESAEELARLRRTTVANIRSQMVRAQKRNGKCKYIKVVMDEEEN